MNLLKVSSLVVAFLAMANIIIGIAIYLVSPSEISLSKKSDIGDIFITIGVVMLFIGLFMVIYSGKDITEEETLSSESRTADTQQLGNSQISLLYSKPN